MSEIEIFCREITTKSHVMVRVNNRKKLYLTTKHPLTLNLILNQSLTQAQTYFKPDYRKLTLAWKVVINHLTLICCLRTQSATMRHLPPAVCSVPITHALVATFHTKPNLWYLSKQYPYYQSDFQQLRAKVDRKTYCRTLGSLVYLI